jgi:hypothetical protein
MLILLETCRSISGHVVRLAETSDAATANKRELIRIRTSPSLRIRWSLVTVLALGVVAVVWGSKSASADDDPPAVLIKLVPGQLPEVMPLNGPMSNAGVTEQGIMIWSTGSRQFVQACPIEKGKMGSGEELSSDSRGGSLGVEESVQPGDALSLRTADLEQIRGTTQYKGKGFLTPAEKEHLLSGKICVRRSPNERSIKYPAVTVEVIRGRKTLCAIPFAENQSIMKWADVPSLPESLKEGLLPGEYSLRTEGTGDSTVFMVDDTRKQDYVLRIPRQLAAILKTKSDPLFLQVAVDHLVGHVDGNGVPCPYYSDALDLLDSVSPESLTPWLKGMREDILVRLGAGAANKKAAPKNSEDETGIEQIDKARKLVSEGNWDKAAAILSGSNMPASPRSKGLTLLYRAVILSESGPSLEDEARTLFMSAITAMSTEDPRDAYRAHIDYANFLTLRAQDRLYNHAFEIASGVPNSLARGLSNWREALEQYELAGGIAKGLDNESQAAVKVSIARVYSLLADVLRTLGPGVNLKREVGLGEKAARQTAASLCRDIVADASSSIHPTTLAAAFETLAHLAFRQGNMKDCRDNAAQAMMLYTATGSLPGIEGIHRLLGLMELKQNGSALASSETAKAQETSLQHLRISHFLSEFLRCRIPSDCIGLARAGYFARRAYVNEQIVELLISSGRHVEALEFAESAKARALQDVLIAGKVNTELDNGQSSSATNMLAAWPEKTCALEYFLGSTRAWVFVVQSGGKVQAYELRKPTGDAISSREIVAQVRRFLTGITGLNRRGIKTRALALEFDHQWQDDLHSLFRILMPDGAMAAVRKAETIVVVPHHVLHYVPFTALVPNGYAGRRKERPGIGIKDTMQQSGQTSETGGKSVAEGDMQPPSKPIVSPIGMRHNVLPRNDLHTDATQRRCKPDARYYLEGLAASEPPYFCTKMSAARTQPLENDGASVTEPLLCRARQLSHEPDGANCVTAISAHITGERQRNGKPALGEGFPVTGVVFCQTRGRRFIAHGSEKNTVCTTENVESEKLLRRAHLSLDIGFCGPMQMTQYNIRGS